jgi:integrase
MPAQARERAREALLQIEAGRDPAAEKAVAEAARKADPIKTFDDLCDAYLEACRRGDWMPKKKLKRERTLNDEAAILRRNVRPVLGPMRPEDVKRGHVKSLLMSLKGRGLGAQTNRTHAVIRQVFAYARGEHGDRFSENPARDLPTVVAERARVRVWSDAELAQLWAALNDKQQLTELKISRQVALALQLTALTLQRVSEVTGMRRSELDLERGIWQLTPDRMKNGKPHVVPLTPHAVELIREAAAMAGERAARPDSPVFPSPRNAEAVMTGNAISHALRDLRKAGVAPPDATVHDLRRTGVTLLTSERGGVAPFYVSKVVGHTADLGGGAGVTMTVYNANQYVAEKRRALETWEALLLEIVGERPRPENVVSQRGVAHV